MSYLDLGQTKYATSSADNRILTLMCCHQFCRMPTRRQPPRPVSPPTSRAVASGLLRSGKRRPHGGSDDLEERLGAMDAAWDFGSSGIRTVKSWRHAATTPKDPEAGEPPSLETQILPPLPTAPALVRPRRRSRRRRRLPLHGSARRRCAMHRRPQALPSGR
jgi:hypothetical protein